MEISDNEFFLFSKIILGLLGIKLAESKKPLIISRLSARIIKLGLGSIGEYLRYIDNELDPRKELEILINRITTNETSFFREDIHFEYLQKHGLPFLEKAKVKSNIRIWCSACSSGEEAYSMAINIREYFKGRPLPDIKILASDINTEVLALGSKGLYEKKRLEKSMPKHLLLKYFKASPEYKDQYQIDETIKKMVVFKKINLLQEKYPIRSKLDIIFCRNVLIYFDETNRDRVIRKFHQYLSRDGLLFIGLSEHLFQHADLFNFLNNTIYQVQKK